MRDAVSERTVQRVCLVSLVILAGYWTAWYADRSLVASKHTSAYYDFENAFPLADAWLAVCLAGTAATVTRQRPTALLFLLTGGGAGVYLLAMDALYDLEHGIWWSGANGVTELAVNVLTAAVSVGLLRWGWRRRAELLVPIN